MKALGYIRVSSVEQANEGISLENQRAKIEAYCQVNDLELVGVIEDGGKSGKNLKREGIQELLRATRSKSFDAVVIYKLDRLSRKVLDTLSLIEHFEKSHIVFHSITEKIDTQSAIGRFFLNITASLAQMERDLISERTKDAMHFKISKNERVGQIPYGRRLAEDGITLMEDETEQKVIEFIKACQAQNYSLRQTCQALTAKGFKPWGKKWHPQTIKNILRKVA